MVVRLLGSAAGGGVPQWNCGCRQCILARHGQIQPRTQCSVAVRANGGPWFLVNASPDLRVQVQSLPSAPAPGLRQVPFEAVLLTDADLDHTLGLLLLREADSGMPVYAAPECRLALDSALRLSAVLSDYCGISWRTPATRFIPLLDRSDQPSGLEFKSIPLAGPGPRYWRSGRSSCRLALVVREEGSAQTVVLAPAIASLEPALLDELQQAAAVLLDGTLWADDDFTRSGVTCRDMAGLVASHLPIERGSLTTMAALPARHKAYVHLNNTNPLLWPKSAECGQVTDAGIQVGFDGLEFAL